MNFFSKTRCSWSSLMLPFLLREKSATGFPPLSSSTILGMTARGVNSDAKPHLKIQVNFFEISIPQLFRIKNNKNAVTLYKHFRYQLLLLVYLQLCQVNRNGALSNRDKTLKTHTVMIHIQPKCTAFDFIFLLLQWKKIFSFNTVIKLSFQRYICW